MTLEFHVLSWDRDINVAGLNRFIGLHSKTLQRKIQLKKHVEILFYSIGAHIITKMNDNINMDSTMAWSMNNRS